MAVQQDGRLVEVRGNPAPATVELALPEDALPATYRGSDEDRMLPETGVCGDRGRPSALFAWP